MTQSEKQCLKILIINFKELGFTPDEIYERMKALIRPLTPEQYQQRIKFITRELKI